MGDTSVPMKALVAVSTEALKHHSSILDVWPKAMQEYEEPTPWELEYGCTGSYLPEELGLKTPKQAGFWVWEGHLYYPGPDYEGVCDSGPDWKGEWRHATPEEVMSFFYGIQPVR